MPKKFGGNTKALEARERKEAAKNAEKDRKEREAEDALWRDEDKHVMRKQNRKEEKEKKKQEEKEKKLANKMAYEEEMSSIKAAKPAPAKVTRAEIASKVEKQAPKPAKTLLVEEQPLEENVNRLQVEGDVARNIDEAIAVLRKESLTTVEKIDVNEEKVDLHPEKRVKAAYQAYEDKNLPRLKEENPNLRLSQLKQMLRKEWMKSPENPMNQRDIGFKH